MLPRIRRYLEKEKLKYLKLTSENLNPIYPEITPTPK